MNEFKTALWIATLLVLLLAVPVLAHKVNLFAYTEGGMIYTESYFPNGRPVAGGKVLVFDSVGSKQLEGTTDKEGLYNFKIPKVADLRIVIEAAMGHKNDFILKKSAVEAGQ